MQRKHETNPNFETTLKGNAENGYCRAYITELFDGVYLPEYDICTNYWRNNFKNGIREIKMTPEDKWYPHDKEFEKNRDDFYAKPLSELYIDEAAAKSALADNLRKLAEVAI